MSQVRLKKLHDMETDLLPLINESDLDIKTEALLSSLSKLIEIDSQKETSQIIVETIIFLKKLETEGEHFLNYEKQQN